MSKYGNNENFKTQIVTNSKRVYDSCASKDYLENLRCYFTEYGQSIVDQSISAKVKNLSILQIDIKVEPISFRRGFFNVNQNFFLNLEIELFQAQSNKILNSLCTFSKNIVLYGSNSDTKIFRSDSSHESSIQNLPLAVVQVSNPIIFDSNIQDIVYADDLEKIPIIPDKILKKFSGTLAYLNAKKKVNLTIGIFSITHLERNVQIAIPSFNLNNIKSEYNEINSKEEFKNMNFPINNFFPAGRGFLNFNSNENF